MLWLAAVAGESLNAVDVIVLVVLVVAFVYGVIRGFVLQLAGIVFIIAGLVLASRFGGTFGDTLHRWFPGLGSPMDGIVGFGLILIGTVLGGHILALIFRGLLEKMKLLSYDRFLGGILGAVKGALVVAVILWGLVLLLDREEVEGEESPEPVKTIYESRSWPLIRAGTDVILPLIPEEKRARAREKLDELKSKIPV
jgi:uncharacterized membrane protein required for colicin V production